jgi:hypothetical protein
VHWPSRSLPFLLLASVSIGTNDSYDLTELPTEHIYALKLNGLSGDPLASFDTSLECMTRATSGSDTFVRYYLFRSFVVLAEIHSPPIGTT